MLFVYFFIITSFINRVSNFVRSLAADFRDAEWMDDGAREECQTCAPIELGDLCDGV